MSPPLIARIPIKNRHGDVIAEKEVVSYAGLLATAHEEGLESIETAIVQTPSDANEHVAIVRAVVKGRRGTFSGLGDADPRNVDPSVSRHLIRIAETRAKARALRDFVNIGLVSLEELGGDEPVAHASAAPESSTAVETPAPPMTEAQRRLLFRLAFALGYTADAASSFLDERAGVRPGETPSRRVASRLIDELDAEVRALETSSTGGPCAA